ncbi:MAG: hypothetical protein M1832_005668 [Thelocarpon impressellum]|nr:MAG: hypothetical protein M1832_005668 [Thelocarpon impressellum]
MGSVVISDVVSDTARFPYDMLAGNAHQQQQEKQRQQQQHQHQHQHRHSSHHSRSSHSPSPASGSHHPYYASASPGRSSAVPIPQHDSATRPHFPTQQHIVPSRPPANAYVEQTPPYDGKLTYAATYAPALAASPPSSSNQSSPLAHGRPASGPAMSAPRYIKVRSLSHIQQLASDDVIQTQAAPSRRSRRSTDDVGPRFEISDMPVTDVIEMVAGLLTKITTTNDRQHEQLHRHIPPLEGATGLSQQTSSVLAFHGKNVPSITILSYLSRIHKYCPTTYEVFLSLLVYFDRMTERVNSGSVESRRPERKSSGAASAERPAVYADKKRALSPQASRSREPMDTSTSPSIVPEPSSEAESLDMSHFFVVDSFNIHRLVIAGVTCASKFFSDVFYTNTRYAKVGGLPLVELNHLEIQFLLLNDFRLSVPVEELEAYGTMLVEFYAREVMAQRQPSGAGGRSMDGVVASGAAGIQTPTPP